MLCKEIITVLGTIQKHKGRMYIFWARSKTFEKRQLASSGLFVRLSLCSHGTSRFPLDGFPRNLIFYDLSKFCLKI
jgi:hypothetical protein